MTCEHCRAPLDPRQSWRGSADLYFCSEFCADAEPSLITVSPPLAPTAADSAWQSQH